MRCWVVELDLRDDDPRIGAWKEGRLRVKPVESVPLHRTGKTGHLEAIPLDDLGASGVVALLDEGNVLTGRGKYSSLMHAVRAVEDRNTYLEEQMEKAAVEAGLDTADRHKRQILEGMGHSLPFVTVPESIPQET